MAAMKRGLPRLVFAPLNRPIPNSDCPQSLFSSLNPPPPAVFSSNQIRTISRGQNDSRAQQKSNSPLSPSAALCQQGEDPLSAKSSFAPRGLGRELEVLVRGQQTSPPTRMVGRGEEERVSESPAPIHSITKSQSTCTFCCLAKF